MIILKVTKNQGFTLSLEDTLFEKPQGGVSNRPPSPPAVLGLRSSRRTSSTKRLLLKISKKF